MRRFRWLLVLVAILTISCTRSVEVFEIKCNQKINPTGVGKTPQFSWILTSEKKNQLQTAYQIIVSGDEASFRNDKENLWNSGKVESNQSLSVPYAGKPLEAGKPYFWKVKIWDKGGGASAWSETGKFITALYDSTDWNGAKWIGYEDIPDSLILVPGVSPWGKNVKKLALRRPVVPLFREEFKADKNIKDAYLFISGLGHYKAFINGQQISDDFLSPGWSDYQKTCLYNTYDITENINRGNNAIGVIVGNGLYNVNNERYRKMLVTFGMPKMICKIKIEYNDGSEKVIVSDVDWKTAPSPITYTSMYGGENYDATLVQTGWDQPDFNDQDWENVILPKHPGGVLKPEVTYPILANEKFGPKEYFEIAKDTFLYDFGQNASGIVKVKVKGEKGQTIRLLPGELKYEDNRINQKATGSPYYYEYTLRGDEEEIYQPFFTYYGLRYIQVENAVPADVDNPDSKPEILDIELLHTYNSAPRVGSFTCSNDLFNRIDKLILYAIQSNFQSVLTDCPHREKLGWLEQTYLMGGSVHYNFDVYHLYKKLVNDMVDSQKDDGMIPTMAPTLIYFGFGIGFDDTPEWGSAGIILPWMIYKWYGDRSVMEDAWPMMNDYIQYLKSKSENYILSYGLGDWYDMGPERSGYPQLTPMGVTATATFYYDVSLMADMAGLMDKTDEKEQLLLLADSIKQAFNGKFYNQQAKVYATGSQTSMAVPLCLDLTPEEDRAAVLKNLVDSINANGKKLTAGDIGFHYLVEALTLGSESQLFYEMNNRDDVPGYGYQLKKGATSLTESWNAAEIVSNNHLMLGHIMEWFYKGLCGIQQADSSIAYKYPVIKPSFVGDITSAKGCYFSPYGAISSEWELESGYTTMKVEIPVNTKAIIYLPTENEKVVTEDGKLLNQVDNVTVLGIEDGCVLVEVGSGKYEFKIVMN